MTTKPLFENQPRVTHADRKRLIPHLSGRNRLCALLESDLTTEIDIQRLIVIEFGTHKRSAIVKKLVGHLHKLQRKRILDSLYHVGT